jgi:hypothetical protein
LPPPSLRGNQADTRSFAVARVYAFNNFAVARKPVQSGSGLHANAIRAIDTDAHHSAQESSPVVVPFSRVIFCRSLACWVDVVWRNHS